MPGSISYIAATSSPSTQMWQMRVIHADATAHIKDKAQEQKYPHLTARKATVSAAQLRYTQSHQCSAHSSSF